MNRPLPWRDRVWIACLAVPWVFGLVALIVISYQWYGWHGAFGVAAVLALIKIWARFFLAKILHGQHRFCICKCTCRKCLDGVGADWVRAGEVAVDAGLIWIGDPCYILHREPAGPRRAPIDLGTNWKEFVNRVYERDHGRGVSQFHRHHTEEGYDPAWGALGCTISAFGGDGVYPVLVRYRDRRVAEVRVVFTPPGVVEA